MSLREQLVAELSDLNVSNLDIDRESTYKGDKGIKVSFQMSNPLGMDTGDLAYEVTYTTKTHLSTDEMVSLTRKNAEHQARAFVFEREVESL